MGHISHKCVYKTIFYTSEDKNNCFTEDLEEIKYFFAILDF